MVLQFLTVLCLALLLILIGWALFGLLLMPVFHRSMVTLYFAQGSGDCLEQRVRAYGWLRECKNGGSLIVVDCGLTQQGLQILQHLRDKRPWLSYCPYEALPDYIELLQHCLENDGDLV